MFDSTSSGARRLDRENCLPQRISAKRLPQSCPDHAGSPRRLFLYVESAVSKECHGRSTETQCLARHVDFATGCLLQNEMNRQHAKITPRLISLRPVPSLKDNMHPSALCGLYGINFTHTTTERVAV